VKVAQEHRGLIEKVILSNKRFQGNEDFLEDFCSETFKRSYLIISSVKNVDHIESYLTKVANSAILEVLKTAGRLTKTSDGYQKIRHEVLNISGKQEFCTDEIIYDIPDPGQNIEEKIIQKETVEQIAEIILVIDSKHREKNYIELFKLRYIKNLSQAGIAQQLELSQGEVSKRLVELTHKINEMYIQKY
jgi:RNA polymerase sigma factor (sigma-70 family)